MNSHYAGLKNKTVEISDLEDDTRGYILLTRLVRRGAELRTHDIHTERFDNKEDCQEILLKLERKFDIASFPLTLKSHIIPYKD